MAEVEKIIDTQSENEAAETKAAETESAPAAAAPKHKGSKIPYEKRKELYKASHAA